MGVPVLMHKGDYELLQCYDGNMSTLCVNDGEYGYYMLVETSDPYTGEYIVTPRVYQQTLETAHKLMTDDVTVLEIPLTRTSNPQGGLTVLIG